MSLWFGVFSEPDRELGIFVGLWVPSILALGALLAPRGVRGEPAAAFSEGGLFAVGAVVFIAVFTAALSLAYIRFAELDEAAERDAPRSSDGDRIHTG